MLTLLHELSERSPTQRLPSKDLHAEVGQTDTPAAGLTLPHD